MLHTHTRISHVTDMKESCHTYEWVNSHVRMRHVAHLNDSCHTYGRVMSHICIMGWLRLVGCLKIQVSLQNTGLFCRALLQKRPIFLSILLIVATPYPQQKRGRCTITRAKYSRSVKSGEDALDALSGRSLSAKEPLIIGFFCGNWAMKIRHHTYLCHPVSIHRI